MTPRNTTEIVNEVKDKIRSYILSEGRSPTTVLINIEDYETLSMDNSREYFWPRYTTKDGNDKLLGLDLFACYYFNGIEVVRK
jgi:hypothetical protein